MSISNDDIIRELKREIKVRKRVYPKWVELERLTSKDMYHRIACLETALAVFEDRKQGRLL